eukprot:TRINITY_DN10451_c0_g1_i1.p1 TRINITY_DN10451_c0_g1~~TRINITY_DN10451_c0_g1_i1.p1  ORF type:complete len:237 (-),score=65.27 TRINITY_DN10451_c0_g1_i1:156-866(-)
MSTLVVCEGAAARANAVFAAELFGNSTPDAVGWSDIATQGEFDRVLAVAEAGHQVDWATLLQSLKPGGNLDLVVDQDDAEGNGVGLAAMIAGLKGVNVAECPVDGSVRVTAAKPDYATGAKAAIKVDPFAAGAEDGEEIDEDSLLTAEEIAAKPELPACGPKSKGRKACKNCSCGFADQLDAEKKGELKAGDQPLFKSACGSCYKGDAFRCADCPYRGMAAFQPGEKVELNMEDDL